MTWTADKIDKGFSNGQVFVRVLFTQDKDTFEEYFRASRIVADWPDDAINSRLDELNSLDLTTVSLGAPAAKKVPEPIPEPTQDELDRAAFFALYRKLQSLQAGVDNALIKPDDQGYLDLQAQVKAAFKPEYGEGL